MFSMVEDLRGLECEISPSTFYMPSLAPRKAIHRDTSLPDRTEQGLH